MFPRKAKDMADEGLLPHNTLRLVAADARDNMPGRHVPSQSQVIFLWNTHAYTPTCQLRPKDMSHEGQLRRHITIVGGSYTAVPEMRQASSTQENCSEQSRLRSEAERLWLMTSADSSATAQPSSSSGALLLHSAMVPAANGYAEWNATKHHADGKAFCDGRMHAVENRVDLPHPVSSSGAFHNAIPSPSRTGIGVPACGGSDVCSDTGWTDMLKDLYEITFDYPPSPQYVSLVLRTLSPYLKFERF
ncbi:uncharacterized protein LOC119175447 isoform X1 [Rhipicephalus microplus]|uniref:uncharacterized protein LOC119175447 isoform X1 n=1 Tax=Rhipicephalus microplus TaxID=6941 RepID=UPI003F6C01A3